MTRRLLLSYLSLAALVLLCLEIPLGFVYSRGERERVVGKARDESESVSMYASLSITAGRAERDLPDRAAHCAERIGGKVVIVDESGGLLATSHPLSTAEVRGLAARPGIAAALRGTSTVDVRTSTIGGVQYLSVAAPVRHGAYRQGAVWITLPTRTVHSRVHHVWLLLALGGLAVLTAVAVVGFAIARWTGHPIRELERATHQLADGGTATPVAVTTGPPEVRSLAATFNRTAARLEHLLASQRAFAGEASHQLKTPLAALRLRLENLESGMAPHARPGLTAAMTETDRLARMVEGLLAMARLDESAATREPVDLDRVCAERHRTWTPLFEQHGVRLVLLGDPAGQVLAVPGAIEQILDNLLSNALRVAPSGSAVTLDVRRPPAPERRFHHRPPDPSRPSRVALHVMDEGPGMTEEQRRRAFDRFWRAPDAPKGGTGLGLALVQRLTHASGGEVELRPARRGGLDAVVRLPSARPPAHSHPSGREGRRRRGAPAVPA
ncbi:histidine kinase [Streptomyces avermitilis]|uniref:histidine kinase n=2 Tax=Streptomyces avermitilis TaxID=33903 RepID=Q82BP9_STRAW|nr:HAMP domain-containing sensor histidine kinase [Streptomyces avermitilis]MYT01231.1 HAMP domain-containing protein [Streptomyces sp. SID5469]KUN50416.1 histidine kinase [Streptomyces avermitilis]OOV30830.1 two-component sensor histidine kinase [Streptomyces avermitilis]BAC73367.1 putative two-component system sensor kinase [Streptomyces avermitilis MA-4680 = NBRC 14893]BBJ53831.1 two-component sensor histidine kinase [Streptomyces avermitilis]